MCFRCAAQGGVLCGPGRPRLGGPGAPAGLTPAGVLCEIMNETGPWARIPDLIPFCREHGLLILTVAELIRYRLRHERYIVRAGESRIQTRYGEFRMIAYESEVNGGEATLRWCAGALRGLSGAHDGPAGGASANGLPRRIWESGASAAVFAGGAGAVHTRCTAGTCLTRTANAGDA